MADLTLAEAERTLYFGAECRICKQVRRVDLKVLVAKLGDDYPLDNVRRRLKCGKCGSKEIVLITLHKSATSSHLMVEKWK